MTTDQGPDESTILSHERPEDTTRVQTPPRDLSPSDPGDSNRRRRGRPKGPSAESGAREALIDSALRLFAARGFEGTTLADVARDAGVAASLVHYYFSSKDELWKTALDSVMSELRDEFRGLEDALGDRGTLHDLEQVIRRFIAFAARHPEVSLILRNERGETGERIEWLSREHWGPLRALPLRLIQQGQRGGVLRPGDPDHLLQIIVGAGLHPLRARLPLETLYDAEPGSDEVVRIHADLVVATLFDGLRHPDATPDDAEL